MNKEKLGCILIIFGLARFIVVTPLYYIMLYMILDHIQATSFMWTFFFIYAPFGFLFAIGSEALATLLKRVGTKPQEEDKSK